MKLRIILILIIIITEIIKTLKLKLIDKQRQKPLPQEVSDVYDSERWNKFINYKSECRKVNNISRLIGLAITIFFILSPYYSFLEKTISNNPYIITVATLAISAVLDTLLELPFNYYLTFTVEEKYGLNKYSKKEFYKDMFLSLFGDLIMVLAIGLLIAFIGENLPKWTNNFSFTYPKALGLVALIFIALFIVVILVSLLSLFLFKIQYKFVELEEGELRNDILKLMDSSKKKVKKIEVYNESAKSTSKNAFLLKLFWYRQFGIADNFINENAHDELLAVLAHEVGHLKHKKNIYNYLKYSFILIFVLAFSYVIFKGNPLYFNFFNYVEKSFDLSTMNYALLITVVGTFLKPITSLISIYNKFVSRKEEYEADDNAVKEGYGQALIKTFKEMSSDELIDVNPHPLIEFLDYDHPGMYNRIKNIEKK